MHVRVRVFRFVELVRDQSVGISIILLSVSDGHEQGCARFRALEDPCKGRVDTESQTRGMRTRFQRTIFMSDSRQPLQCNLVQGDRRCVCL